MSDLIDFDSPNSNNVVSLPSPLIPAPDTTKNSGINLDEAGSHFFDFSKRHSSENNPFDTMMKKITEYEKNSEDPFEKVISKAMSGSDGVAIESKNDFIPKHAKSLEVLKSFDESNNNLDISPKEDMYKLVQEENVDMSIITDLNNTNLINDNVNHKKVISLQNCDNKLIPNVNVSPPTCIDLSILNNSVMNDSLLDQQNIVTKKVVTLDIESNLHAQSMTEINFLSPKRMVQKKIRRTMSVCEASKNCTFGEGMLSMAQSSIFEDPLNNAFRKVSSSNRSSESSYLSNQFDLNIYKQKMERLNSDSSVFSGLSNISAITADSLTKIRNERFYSESSASSGISNLSIIPTNYTTLSSCNSATFLNDTANKGFIASKLRLSSINSSVTEKNCSKTINKPDLIKKFVDIKTRMSTNLIESQTTKNKPEYKEDENISSSKYNVSVNNEYLKNNDEKLIDIDNSSNSVFNDNGVDDIISHEAKALAETFEKMSSTKENNLSVEDELFFSLTQLNFDDLPSSEDEAVENLIELAPTSLTSISNIEQIKEKNISESNVSIKDNIIDIENEFSEIELRDVNNKKANAATLLLNLKQLIKEENNPDASKVLEDLEKLLGIKCENNTEILKTCLQNRNNSHQKENKSQNNLQCNQNISYSSASNSLNDSNERVHDNCRNNLLESMEITKNHQNVLCNQSLSSKNESSKILKIDEKTRNESENMKKSVEHKIDLDESAEDQKLAINLLRTLNKILNKKTVDTTDVLKNLGTVLNMATEMRVNVKDKQICKLKGGERRISKQLNNSTSTLYKSPNRKSVFVKSQNKSLDILPLRRSTSINPVCNNDLLDIQHKDKKKTQLLNIKKRFPSDPGFPNPTADIRNEKSVGQVEQQISLEIKKTAVIPIKKKLKKTQSAETITKKGPLKAVIPLGNMQKRVSISKRISDHKGDVTPPKSINTFPAISIPTSTPNTSRINNNSKSKPKACSTPNAEELKVQNVNITIQQNSKKTLKGNLSLVSLNPSPRGKVTDSKNNIKRMGKSLSPQNKQYNPKKNFENCTESRLPKYSPRPKKTAKLTQKANDTVSNISSEKKYQRHSVLSPLKNCNNLVHKAKPISLISRLGTSNITQMDPEKENYA